MIVGLDQKTRKFLSFPQAEEQHSTREFFCRKCFCAIFAVYSPVMKSKSSKHWPELHFSEKKLIPIEAWNMSRIGDIFTLVSLHRTMTFQKMNGSHCYKGLDRPFNDFFSCSIDRCLISWRMRVAPHILRRTMEVEKQLGPMDEGAAQSARVRIVIQVKLDLNPGWTPHANLKWQLAWSNYECCSENSQAYPGVCDMN